MSGAFQFLLLAIGFWQAPTTQSWDFLRGGNFDGVSTEIDLIETWPEAGPPVLWERNLGQGYSGFTCRADRVFTQYQTLTTQFVICLDANSGETLWQTKVGWAHKPAGLYPGPRSTPTLDNQNLYYTTPNGVVGCLKQSDGGLVWKRSLYDEFEASPVEFGFSISPTLVKGRIFLPVGGAKASIVALDSRSGQTVWTSQGDAISHAGLLPIRHNGRENLVGYLKNSLVLLDMATGEKLASFSLSEGYDEHSAWPIYREPYLWIAAPFRRGSQLFEITDDDPPKFTLVRQSYEMSNDVSSSVLVGDTLYGFDIADVQSKVHRCSRGQFRAIDFASGEHLWSNGVSKRRVHEEGDIGHASFVYADGKLILLNDAGELILGSVDRKGFEEIGRASLLADDICWTQPTLCDGRVFLRNHKRAICVYLGDPIRLDSENASIGSTSEFHVEQGWNWASLVFSIEPEYAMDAPTDGWLVSWFFAILLCVVGSWALSLTIELVLRMVQAKRATKNLDAQRKSRIWFRYRVRIFAFMLGVIGTTLLSGWYRDFLFTWPLAMFVLFDICLNCAKPNRNQRISTTQLWQGRIALLIFLLAIAGYYFLCRRLSLAFEWAFLTGFPFSVPFLLLACAQHSKPGLWAACVEWTWWCLALAAFYWAGAGLIIWKY